MSQFEGITKINIIGSPEITIPSTMTVETVLQAMQYKLEDYHQRIEGSTLVLSTQAGTKGALDVRLVNGKVLPRGGRTFPTDGDIDILAELFPEDNLFETLEDPIKLQEYATTLSEKSEEILENIVAKQENDKFEAIKQVVLDLVNVTKAIAPYAIKIDNPAQPIIAGVMNEALTQLKQLLTLAEAHELDAVKHENELSENEALLEEIRKANPDLEI